MQTIDDPGDALAVLHDPGFVVPPVPAATRGVAWLRAGVGRFSTGVAYTRRRALSESLLSTVDPAKLRAAAASAPHTHPVHLIAAALGLPPSDRTTLDAVRAVAAAYQPGTGDEALADAAVEALVDTFGGTADEATAARIGLLVQACDATATLIARARAADLETALRDTPPVAATRRMATRPADLRGVHVEAGEVVRVSLHGIPFGAGPRACPGRAHALALAEGALSGPASAGDSSVPDGDELGPPATHDSCRPVPDGDEAGAAAVHDGRGRAAGGEVPGADVPGGVVTDGGLTDGDVVTDGGVVMDGGFVTDGGWVTEGGLVTQGGAVTDGGVLADGGRGRVVDADVPGVVGGRR